MSSKTQEITVHLDLQFDDTELVHVDGVVMTCCLTTKHPVVRPCH